VVKFPLTSVPAELQSALAGRPAFAVIWTTTPWTLPANLAIAVHPTQEYVAVEVAARLIVARALLTFPGLFSARAIACRVDARPAARRPRVPAS